MGDSRDPDGMFRAALNNAANDIDDVGANLKARGLLSASDEATLSDAKAVLFEAWQKISTAHNEERN